MNTTQPARDMSGLANANSEVIPRPSIEDSLAALRNSVDGLEKSVCGLGERLTSLMEPGREIPPNPVYEESRVRPGAVRSPAVESIDRMNTTIRSITNTVNSITSRVQS